MPLATCRLLALVAACAACAAACGPRQVAVDGDDPRAPTADAPSAVPQADGAFAACDLPPGIHGAGALEATAPPDLDAPAATFTTDGPSVAVALPIAPGTEASVLIRRGSSLPVLPRSLQLEALPGDEDPWTVTVQLAWCGEQECRIALYAGSQEPTDRLEGWLAFEGRLFSDLTRVAVCLAADDGGERRLTINTVALRPAH